MQFLYNFSTNPLYIRLAASILLLLLALIGHRLFSRFMIKLVSRIEIKNIRMDTVHLEQLQNPFNYLFLVTGFFIALAISPFVIYTTITSESFWSISIPISIIPFAFLARIYTATVTGLITWILYLVTHIYEDILYQINFKIPFMNNSLFIRFTARMTRIAIVIIGVFVGLICIFPKLSTILTGVGLGGVAVAFVSKDALAKILSGVLVMLDKPFVIGDWIETGDLEGVVEDISFRSTRLRTFTQGQVIIPTSQIGNANLINWTRMEKRRVKFDLGVDYGTSIKDLTRCIEGIKNILYLDTDVEKETYLVTFENFGDYALNIQIYYFSLYTDYATYLQVKQRINFEILRLCEDLNINIAFPTQTLYMERMAPHQRAAK